MDARRQFSMIGWSLTAFYLICTVLQMTVGMIFEQFGHLLPWYIWTDDFLMVESQVVMYGIAFPVFYLMVRKLPSWYMTEKRYVNPADLFTALVICIGTAYLGNMIGTALMIASDLFFGTESMNPVTNAVLNMSPWVMFVTTVVAAPIMEELMFRRILIDRLVPFGQKMAVIVSGLSFGLFHGNFYQFFYACSLGMVFAYLYSYTGKLRYSVMLHMGVNLIGGVLPMILQRGMEAGSLLAQVGSVLMSMLAIACIITMIVLACILGGKLTWFPCWLDCSAGSPWKSVVMAPGMWVFLLVSIVQFVWTF